MRKTASQSGSEIRFGKVEELRRLFETGGYQPDPYRIAEAMVSYARRSLLARPLDGPPSA
ncbi:MAG: flagellar biosynthesis anti-sigma factor FlgM [Deltaproteobacteria bacterium]|nr:MAG: flagellar biosynthesis anti-sigma factor FlgM [Deltaproteobacteria bacterium]TMB36643.1 MAG: flagellar biosynthesis anti-sigma factor FlgM [Deltaproteobacteria bacterium]